MLLARRLVRSCIRTRTLSTRTAPLSQGSGPVTLTDRCVERLRIVTAEDGSFLRVSVEGGGCSGFQYMFKLDKDVTKDDCVFEKNGMKVVIDKESMDFLKGATIDYNEELIRSSFQIVNNPKAEKPCSCGTSFSVKF